MRKSVLVPIGGILIIVCFFLPWTKACSVKLSGLQLASDSIIGDPVFWVVLASGIGVLAGFFLARGSKPVILLSALFGSAILVIKIIIPLLRGEFKEIDLSLDVGGYGTILGFILAFIGGLFEREPPPGLSAGYGRPDIRKDMDRLDRK